jgi:hypothetical protein
MGWRERERERERLDREERGSVVQETDKWE